MFKFKSKHTPFRRAYIFVCKYIRLPDAILSFSSFQNNETKYCLLYEQIEGIADENVYEAPVSNRIYYSNADNRVVLTAKVSNTDQFRCNWTITPRGITVNNKRKVFIHSFINPRQYLMNRPCVIHHHFHQSAVTQCQQQPMVQFNP